MQLQKVSRRNEYFLNVGFLLVLASFLFFHNIGEHFILMFQLDFVFVLPYTYYYYRRYSGYYFKNNFYRNLIVTFTLLALFNLLSVYAGKFLLHYPTTIKGVSLSIVYIIMLIYLTFGAVLAIHKKYLNFSLLIHVVSLILIIISLYEYFDKEFAVLLRQYYNVIEEILKSNDPNKFRLIGTFKNANNLGLMSIILFFLTLFNKGNRILKVIVTVGFIIVIFMTGSRTAFVLLLVVFVYYLVHVWSLRNVSVLVLIVGVFAIIIFNFINIYETAIFWRLEETSLKYMFYARQTIYWNDAIKVFLDSPVFGVGRFDKVSFTTDNYYLYLLKTNGIIGLLLWIGFLYQLIRVSLRYYFSSINAKILIGIIIIILVSSITGDFYISRLFYPLIMIIIGYYSYLLLIETDYFNKSKNKQVII